MARRFAAIDIGTVTCRMLVADVADGRVAELAKEYAVTNLGEGVDATGELKPEAMQRVACTIDRYLAVRDSFVDEEHPSIETLVMATSASRDARNAADFRQLLAQRGVELSVIPGQREAALSFMGASCDFTGERIMVVDIGGGSTEIIVGEAGGVPEASHSFNIGCRRVTERYFQTDPPTSSEIESAAQWIAEEMRTYLDKLKADGYGACRVVAVAGTATSVVSMREKMAVYDSNRVHGAIVTRADIDSLLGELAGKTLEERQSVVGLEPQRAPVIVAGVLILQQIMEVLGAETLTVSERDILHGIILDAASR